MHWDKYEQIILASAICISVASVWFIPRRHIQLAHFSFLFTQFLIWICGLLVVEWRLLEYPLRLFSRANSTSFVFEYGILPILCIFVQIYYPSKQS